MRRADAGRGGRKIGFDTNHHMPSHIRGHGAEGERKQNPLCNKWVQHPIFHVRFETACSKPPFFPQEMADPSMSAPRMCEHTRGSGVGMSKSARLHSATALRICERSLIYAFHMCEPVLTCFQWGLMKHNTHANDGLMNMKRIIAIRYNSKFNFYDDKPFFRYFIMLNLP